MKTAALYAVGRATELELGLARIASDAATEQHCGRSWYAATAAKSTTLPGASFAAWQAVAFARVCVGEDGAEAQATWLRKHGKPNFSKKVK